MEYLKHLGINIKRRKNMLNEVRQKINMANRIYFTMNKMFSSRTLSWKTKKKLYCYLRPISIYACEKWSTTMSDEENILIFERKIYGPIRNTTTSDYERRKSIILEQMCT